MRQTAALSMACAAHVLALVALPRREPALHVAVPSDAVSEIDLEVNETSEARPAVMSAADTPESPVGAKAVRWGQAAAKVAPTAQSVNPPNDEAAGLEHRVPGWVFPMGPARPENEAPHARQRAEPNTDEARLRIDLRAATTPDLVTPHGEKPATASRTGGVAEALAAHDVELGMGRGGPILAAAESAARESDLHASGVAVLDVAVRTDGAVVARVTHADGDSDAWARVAESVARSLDAKRIRIPPGSRGWHVVVRIEAKVQFSDGRDVRSLQGPRSSLAPSVLSNAIEGKQAERGSSTEPGGPDHVGGPTELPPAGGALGRHQPSNSGAAAVQGIAQRVLPTPTLSVRGKSCSAALTVTPLGVGLGGGCSLENIGTPATRIVSGRIVSEGSI
jgi:hypothetical protein